MDYAQTTVFSHVNLPLGLQPGDLNLHAHKLLYDHNTWTIVICLYIK